MDSTYDRISKDRFNKINSLLEARFLLNILFSQATEKNVLSLTLPNDDPKPGTEMKMKVNSNDTSHLKFNLKRNSDCLMTDTNKFKDGRGVGEMIVGVDRDEGQGEGEGEGGSCSNMNSQATKNKLNTTRINFNNTKYNTDLKSVNTLKSVNSNSVTANNSTVRTKFSNIIHNNNNNNNNSKITGKGVMSVMRGNNASNQLGIKSQSLPLANNSLSKSSIANNVINKLVGNSTIKGNINNAGNSSQNSTNMINNKSNSISNSISDINRKNTSANVAASLLNMTANIKKCLAPQGGPRTGHNQFQKIRKLNEISTDKQDGNKKLKTVNSYYSKLKYISLLL